MTNIDKVVPEDGLEKMFQYPCAKRYCREAGNDFRIPMQNVFLVSNYHDEGVPTPTKNAMALHVLWKMVHLCINYIENKEARGDVLEGFYD